MQENRDPAYVLVLTVRTAIDSWLSSTWGLAAIAAYRAYKDPSSLRYAQSIWTQLTAFLVTPEDAASGTHPMRSVNISGMCNGGELSDPTTPCHINIQHPFSYYCWCGIRCTSLIHTWISLCWFDDLNGVQFPINPSKLDIAGVTVTYVQWLQVRFRSLTAEIEHSWRERSSFYHPSIR